MDLGILNLLSFQISRGRKCFSVWDVSGQEKTRSLWRSYCRQTDLIMFVVDSADQERMEEAKIELETILKVVSRTKANVPLLVLANKQDLPGAMTTGQMETMLGLKNFRNQWKIFDCCAVTGEGLETVLKDADNIIKQSKVKHSSLLKIG